MFHVVQFSGGCASAWVAWYVLQNEKKEQVILLNHDPGAEHEDSLRFQKEISKYLNHPIIITKAKMTLWEEIEHQKCFPNNFRPYCTRILKIETGDKFLKTLKEKYIIYNGFDKNEWQRVQRATIRGETKGIKVISPLFELGLTGDYTKKVIKETWGICLPEPYKYMKHNNCLPCFKAGKKHFIKVAKYFPDYYEKACKAEESIGYTVFKDINLRQLKEKNNYNQLELFKEDEILPCMCAN